VRVLLRPRRPLLVLLLLAPSIPELLTGSTPITRLFVDPIGFAVGFAFEIGLYGCGALVVRELAVTLRRGFPSILLWGAAYGIAEEGLAVHTFFERSGPPVGALTTYGSAYGVNWLWALGLTVFHATYSIALPILLVYLAYPEARGRRWTDRGALTLVLAVYLATVAVFAALVGYGPNVWQLVLFVALAGTLVALGTVTPADLLRRRGSRPGWGGWGLGFAGALSWCGWLFVLAVSGRALVPAAAAAAVVVLTDAAAVAVVILRVRTDAVEPSAFAFAVGMLVPLFLFDIALEPSVPGILAVSALAAYLLYRLGRRIERRSSATPIPAARPG